jgi:hypothetical protein
MPRRCGGLRSGLRPRNGQHLPLDEPAQGDLAGRPVVPGGQVAQGGIDAFEPGLAAQQLDALSRLLGAVIVPVMAVAFVGLDRADVPHASILTRIAQQVGGSFGTGSAGRHPCGRAAHGRARADRFDGRLRPRVLVVDRVHLSGGTGDTATARTAGGPGSTRIAAGVGQPLSAASTVASQLQTTQDGRALAS